MGRGLYNQNEGNEHRNGQAAALDHYQDNQIAEGREAATIRRMMSEKKYGDVDNFVNKLRAMGWSPVRLQAMMANAMMGLKL